MIRKIRLSSERFRELVSLVSEKSVIRGAREVFYDKSDSVTPRRKESDWILDFRRTFLDSKGITLLSEIFWDIYGDVPEFQIATVEL
ncbi:MAG: hypothetical protein QG650_139 [Patescibacteria group bacterium]|nr:hypothetical protein [Patescibacteria group bacterium]